MDGVIPLLERSLHLSPRDPSIYNSYNFLGLVHLVQSRIDEAIIWLERARNANQLHPLIPGHLAAAYGLKGDTERAAAELAAARRLSSDGRYSNIARLKASGYFGVPKIRALYEDTLFAGLRLAGMPEE